MFSKGENTATGKEWDCKVLTGGYLTEYGGGLSA